MSLGIHCHLEIVDRQPLLHERWLRGCGADDSRQGGDQCQREKDCFSEMVSYTFVSAVR
jgi:hypothetical protein